MGMGSLWLGVAVVGGGTSVEEAIVDESLGALVDASVALELGGRVSLTLEGGTSVLAVESVTIAVEFASPVVAVSLGMVVGGLVVEESVEIGGSLDTDDDVSLAIPLEIVSVEFADG